MQVGGRTNSSATNFTRNRPRVTTESVLEAAIAAAEGHAFEVLYYPRATMFEFCVREEAVAQALQQNWVPGLRFRMAVETEDASRISWFMGTICKVEEADPLRWPNSIWKRLQVIKHIIYTLDHHIYIHVTMIFVLALLFVLDRCASLMISARVDFPSLVIGTYDMQEFLRFLVQ